MIGSLEELRKAIRWAKRKLSGFCVAPSKEKAPERRVLCDIEPGNYNMLRFSDNNKKGCLNVKVPPGKWRVVLERVEE